MAGSRLCVAAILVFLSSAMQSHEQDFFFFFFFNSTVNAANNLKQENIRACMRNKKYTRNYKEKD